MVRSTGSVSTSSTSSIHSIYTPRGVYVCPSILGVSIVSTISTTTSSVSIVYP